VIQTIATGLVKLECVHTRYLRLGLRPLSGLRVVCAVWGVPVEIRIRDVSYCGPIKTT